MRHAAHNTTATTACQPGDQPRNSRATSLASPTATLATTSTSRYSTPALNLSAISNRHSGRLEITVTRRKQTTEHRSNRHFSADIGNYSVIARRRFHESGVTVHGLASPMANHYSPLTPFLPPI